MSKIDITKQYKTRLGLPVRIYAVDGGGDYDIHGAYYDNDLWTIESWHESGYCYENGLDDGLDLIEVDKYDDFKIDDKVLIWNYDGEPKIKRHFAGLNLETRNPNIWVDGKTSFTTNIRIDVNNCELYIEDKDNK